MLSILFHLCALVAAQINPLPPNTPTLCLRYPDTSWVRPGDTLLKSKTQTLPIISAHDLNPKSTYLLLFVDLDVLYEKNATTILHWYQPDMVPVFKPNTNIKSDLRHFDKANPYSNGILANQSIGAEYIAPQPPPYSRHRYVYLLFNQRPNYSLPKCYAHIFPPTFEARGGFDTRQFVDVTGLGAPVAGNYFLVEYDGPVIKPTVTARPTTTWLRSAPCEGVTPTSLLACEGEGNVQAGT